MSEREKIGYDHGGLEEFLVALRRAAYSWHLEVLNNRSLIRTRLGSVLLCPIEADVQVIVDAADDVQAIIDAADEADGHDPMLRSRLLQACGLGEECKLHTPDPRLSN